MLGCYQGCLLFGCCQPGIELQQQHGLSWLLLGMHAASRCVCCLWLECALPGWCECLYSTADGSSVAPFDSALGTSLHVRAAWLSVACCGWEEVLVVHADQKWL